MKILALSEIRLIEIASQYRDLKESGDEFLARCINPNHADHNPSMFINPSKNVFKCMSCGAGGGVLAFLRYAMNTQDISRIAYYLKQSFGIKLSGQARDRHEKELEVLKWAHEKFKRNLDEMLKLTDVSNPSASYSTSLKDFLKDRGITIFQVRKHELGLATLFDDLKDKGYDEEILHKAGLIFDNPGHSEIFDGRLIFPIKDEYGKVRGFSGRTLFRAKQKYLNSPSSEVFDKNTLFYQGEILPNVKDVIIVEGPIDAIIASEHLGNVIAKQGSALTHGMIKKLVKYVDRVTLFYDGDKAGDSALIKDLVSLSKTDLSIEVIVCPEDKDPGSLTTSEYNQLKRLNLVTWYVKHLLKTTSKEVQDQVYDNRMDKAYEFIRAFKGCNYKYIRSICEAFKVDVPERKIEDTKIETSQTVSSLKISQIELDFIYALCHLYDRDETILALLMIRDIGFEIFSEDLVSPMETFTESIAFGLSRHYYPITKNAVMNLEIKNFLDRRPQDYDMKNFLVCITRWVESYKASKAVSAIQQNLETVKKTPALTLVENIQLKRKKLGGL